MPIFKSKPSRMLIVLAAMAILLPLLAALQYYWLGQVSEAATARLQLSLQGNATRFRQDFNREFIRAYLNFHMDSLQSADDLARLHLERLTRWNQSAPFPRLIGEVYLVDYNEAGQPRLSRLDTNARRLDPVNWSDRHAGWRERFERTATDSVAGKTPAGSSLESFAGDIPALIVPLPVLAGEAPGDGSSAARRGFTILTLDLDYLRHEFIPNLTQRHFSDEPGAHYDVAVVSLRNPQQVIYSSPNPSSDFSAADVSTRIFGIEADELRAFIRSEAAPLAESGQPGARQVRMINLRYLKAPAPPSASGSDEEGRWRLLIKHQSGSLAAAMSGARRRNLAISFGILLLLGAGILMTAISTRRAERLARQQLNFVAGVTHELRTPLAVISSAGENLAAGIVDTPEKVAQYGEVVYREGRRLTDMVEQVLEFAGAQSGRQRYEFRPTAIADVIDGAIAACAPQMLEKEFTVEKVIEPDLPEVNCDEAALKRAVQNLIDNAIKYDSENRWACISVQSHQRKQERELSIAIEDRGVGIPATDLEHIFEPFYRGGKAMAAQIKGSGIGLSLVKQIMEAHGGSVSAKSEPGRGSVFTLHLPVDNS